MSLFLMQLLSVVLLVSVIFLHLTKKNFGAAITYGLQSLAVALVLWDSFLGTGNVFILLVAISTLIIKVVLAPVFFASLIQKHDLKFSVSPYLNTPLTLIVLATFVAVAHSRHISPLTAIIPAHHALLSMGLSAILISLFLIVNRKDALSQILGILSLENGIVAFAIFAGLEQTPMLQIGILFNLLIWISIAAVFIAMIFKHFGSLDTSLMKHLKD